MIMIIVRTLAGYGPGGSPSRPAVRPLACRVARLICIVVLVIIITIIISSSSVSSK